MTIAVCVDEHFGLLFCGRRLSRDRVQQEDLLALCAGRPLRISPASAALFDWAGERVSVDANYLRDALPEEICFLEEPLSPDLESRVERVILYHWNRAYPSDTRFTLDLSAFSLTETLEFPGKSHERITREQYERSIL